MGCTRRNLWTGKDNTYWPHLRGNAVLESACTVAFVHTDWGTEEAYIFDRCLVEYRAGEWKPYWVDDIMDRWALFREKCGMHIEDDILVVHENKDNLTIRTIRGMEASKRVARMESEASKDPPGRIAKNTLKAYNTCYHCPVKRQCDKIDREQGETDDWGSNYPFP